MKRLGCLVVVFVAALSMAHARGEIHGTIETSSGETLTGPIHWDQHENFWSDSLDARKFKPSPRDDGEGFRFSLFGVSIGDLEDGGHAGSQFSIPFGHLKSIVRTGSNRALLVLKSGEEFEILGGGDIGHGLNDLWIEDVERGHVELSWRQLDRVVFTGGPDEEGRDADRLYGTMKTDDGEFTGFIVWDSDESFVEEVLDGDDGKTDREIPFGEIREIERVTRGSRVTLASGESVTLSGTNDVDSGHRGVVVVLEGIGTLDVDWRTFKSVKFAKPPAPESFAAFDGGYRLRGTVHTRDGRELGGEIVWDLDETYSWENLDGDVDDLEYSIPFANIRSITPLDDDHCSVVLKNGRELRLGGSNDVDYDNRGLIVKTPFSLDEIDWSDVARVEFK